MKVLRFKSFKVSSFKPERKGAVAEGALERFVPRVCLPVPEQWGAWLKMVESENLLRKLWQNVDQNKNPLRMTCQYVDQDEDLLRSQFCAKLIPQYWQG